jgi:hypothetical protein
MWRRSRWLGLIAALALLITACDQNVFLPKVEPEPVPVIAWTSPGELAELRGSTTFSVAKAGDVDFASVTFVIDGSSFTRSNGSLVLDMGTFGIAPGPFEAAATAKTALGHEYTAYRTFIIPEVPRPTISWVRPHVLEAIVPDWQFDMTARVSDESGEITRLLFFVDDNLVHTMLDIDDVATAKDQTFRWHGFSRAFGRVTLRVEAYNAAGGMASATREVLSIPARPVLEDLVPPIVWWDQSTIWNNRAVAGEVTFLARAEDNVEVAYFEFLINDALVDRVLPTLDGSVLPRRRATVTWNTAHTFAGTLDGVTSNAHRTYPDGEYAVTVVAVDTSGNRSSAETLTVRVANDDKVPPVATWYTKLYPTSATDLYDGKVLTGTVELTVVGSDNVGMSRYEFWVGNSVVGTLSAGPSNLVTGYGSQANWTWNTRSVQSGYHTLGVVAIDQAGNRSEKAFVNVIVVNDPPFRFQSFYDNYAYGSGGGLTVWGRRNNVQSFRVDPVDTGYNLTVCEVHLLVANYQGANFPNSGSYGDNVFGPLGRVAEINGVRNHQAGLFAKDPVSGAYEFQWDPRLAVVKWDVNGVYTSLVAGTNWTQWTSRTVISTVYYTYYHWPIRFAADVAVSHSPEGCASNNQAYITFFRTENYIQMNGSVFGETTQTP